MKRKVWDAAQRGIKLTHGFLLRAWKSFGVVFVFADEIAKMRELEENKKTARR